MMEGLVKMVETNLSSGEMGVYGLIAPFQFIVGKCYEVFKQAAIDKMWWAPGENGILRTCRHPCHIEWWCRN